jgi:8-oxo-dGTP diphosphatase
MNQYLKDKVYSVPSDVIKYILTVLVSNSTGEGVRRAKFIVKNGVLTYQELKGLKHFFDTFNLQSDNKIQYALAGGNLMKGFIERTLNSDRDAAKKAKEVKSDAKIDVNLGTKTYSPAPELNEAKKDLKKNAVAVIVNDDDKILLLKRADDSKIWQPNKWSLVGGGIEKNETPEQAVKREIKEETGLDVNKFVKTFTIQRNPDSIEYIFACRHSGDPTDITLNEENTGYGWYDIDEMKFLDIVPNLVEYIILVFKPYDDDSNKKDK